MPRPTTALKGSALLRIRVLVIAILIAMPLSILLVLYCEYTDRIIIRKNLTLITASVAKGNPQAASLKQAVERNFLMPTGPHGSIYFLKQDKSETKVFCLRSNIEVDYLVVPR